MRRIKTLCGLLACLLLLAVCPRAQASAQTQTLRVGYIDYHGFIDREDGGSYTGYGAEYLARISEYSGFQYEYVYGEWSRLLAKLAAGEIDILCHAQFTRERAETFDYSAYPIGYTQGLLYARKDNDALCYEDFRAFDGITVGVLRGSAMTDIFAKYAAQNGFSYSLREYDTDEKSHDALNLGEIDAICSEHLANHTGLSLLANFGADAYYIISYKGNPFMERINFALQEIKTDVDFEAELYHKYYDGSSAACSTQFTLEEKQYIQNADTLLVGLMADRSPLSYADKNGRARGMIVELMDKAAYQSGLTFEYRFLGLGQTGYDFLTNSGGDLVAGVASSVFSTLNPALLQSDALLSSDVVFVGRDGTGFKSDSALTVALPAGFINGGEAVSALYPNFDFYNAATNDDCLKAIRDGKADVMLQNLYIIRECLQSPVYEGLDIFPAFSFTEEEKVVALPGNETLMSVINKSFDAIADEQINEVVISNTIAKSYHAGTGEILYKFRLPLAGIAFLLVTIIVLFMVMAAIRRRNYLAVEKVNAQLEKANARLEDAVRQADRANTAKSRFLSRMSHEIRTPMNAIVGLTEIAKQNERDPVKIDDCLGKIAVSSKVLLNILGDVLDMSAIESGKLKISRELFDIKQVLNGISAIYYPQCKTKGISFHMATDLEDEYLLGDSLRVSQILLNLVSNAYKFTDPGGSVRISVKETARQDGRAFLRFSVSDTGRGMSEDMKARLFKPFEQETSGTAKRFGGSGLGLSIAKNLVDMMSGAIRVRSELGKGTVFEIDLPFDVAEKAGKYSIDALADVRVLTADGDEVSRDYTATVLRRIGAPFDVARSGGEALRMIAEARESEKPYAVALIDWKMPDMDGLEAARRIRAQEKDKPPVIIVSAYDPGEARDEARAAAADHFVLKPLFQSTVFNALMELAKGGLKKPAAKAKEYDFTGRRVLLAEDQDLNAEIAIELLGLAHMSADRAENGKRALEMFASSAPGTYDAILMDVQMPEMDGYEAAMAIRELKRPDAKYIPIFAMTANAFTQDVSAALCAGMNGHIAKPVDTNILYETLRKVVEGEFSRLTEQNDA